MIIIIIYIDDDDMVMPSRIDLEKGSPWDILDGMLIPYDGYNSNWGALVRVFQ